MPKVKSPSDMPPIIPLNDKANCNTGPKRSTANTKANDRAPKPRHTQRAICKQNTGIYIYIIATRPDFYDYRAKK